MIEYVFRRKRGSKLSEYWIGRFSLARGEKPTEVHLGLKDEAAARAKLREIVTEKQQERYGVIPKKSYRDAASLPIAALITAYETDLTSQERSPAHVKESAARIRKVIKACKWRRIGDITPATFIVWRARCEGAAKTRKEYQVSINAWLNWLVNADHIERNPLKKIKLPETRGKSVRPSRALTIEELRALFAVAGDRALAYQMLAYTGQRCCEIAALRWWQIDLGANPCIRVLEDQTKDLDNRAIPLHPGLAEKLRAAKPENAARDALVFKHFPALETFYADLKRAGIARKDEAGRFVNLHALRKTFQTMSVVANVNQRATQAILGHSDANTTAQIYTHVPALGLSDEIKKLPWWEPEKPAPSGETTKTGKNATLIEKLKDLANLLEVFDGKGLQLEPSVANMAARHGFEP